MTITEQAGMILDPEERFFTLTLDGISFRNLDGRLSILKDGKLLYDGWANPPAAAAIKKYLKPGKDWTGTKVLSSGVTVTVEKHGKHTYVYVRQDGKDIRKPGCGNRSVYGNAYTWLRNRGLVTADESWEIFHR